MLEESARKSDATNGCPPKGRCSMGAPGMNDVLGGGLPTGHFYLLEGEPGTGKTTMALQFVIEGLRRGEKGLYVTLSESRRDLMVVAEAHGFNVEGLNTLELLPGEQDLGPEGQYTVFHPAEVELSDRTQSILAEVMRLKPERLVIDALSELRMMARDILRYRRQILSLKESLANHNCTVLLLDDRTSWEQELELHSIVHGVISLTKVPREYGKMRRRLEVTKLRGCAFREGYHDYIIRTGGVVVYPRLVAAEYRSEHSSQLVHSGIGELDALAGGGLDRGTSTLLVGPAGSGKTTIALRWACSAAERGEKAVAFIFEESVSSLSRRATGLGMDVERHVASHHMRLEQVDPAEMSPGEFVEKVRHAVEQDHVGTIIIDSLNGFLQSMPGEQFLALHLHELLAYLNNRNVLTLMIVAQAGMIGSNMQTPVDVSYLADSIFVLRYFEAHGAVRQAISMIKKRSGGHERTIRELVLGPHTIRLGEPLKDFQGVLSGIPILLGQGNGNAVFSSVQSD
ncbi:MAG TPA: ATPase domain-containing protein [Terriglobales bacterium]|nr:ATPase domain-containing protein [Terriglobales bacterium]